MRESLTFGAILVEIVLRGSKEGTLVVRLELDPIFILLLHIHSTTASVTS